MTEVMHGQQKHNQIAHEKGHVQEIETQSNHKWKKAMYMQQKHNQTAHDRNHAQTIET